MSFSFHVPTEILFGPGALQTLPEEKLPGMAPLARRAVGPLFDCALSPLSAADVVAVLEASYR
ncbi:MAG: hypothetical protein IJS32_05200 [Kiritimatiellae bacterium]|nr:hypothetical protein [Kiritimatiellia bacterium]